MRKPSVHSILAAAGQRLKRRPWLQSMAVTALAVTASVWLWFGPWLWPGIPWLVVGAFPFLIGLCAPKTPLLFAMLPLLVPYVAEGAVRAPILLGGLGASYMAAAVGILVRRLRSDGGV